LAGNQLQEITPAIGKLKKLYSLWLTQNQITHLPPEIGELSQLVELNLSKNQLKCLPESIKKLAKNLQFLYLQGNLLFEEEKQKIKSWLPQTAITW
jgi:Leucine-rich repeat (LRR) protein